MVDGSNDNAHRQKQISGGISRISIVKELSILEDLQITQCLLLMDIRTELKIVLIAVGKNNFVMTSRLEKI